LALEPNPGEAKAGAVGHFLQSALSIGNDMIVASACSGKEEPMSDLASKTCVPCRGGVPPVKGADLDALLKQVSGWSVVNQHHLTKAYKFPDFRQALAFVNRVGEIAEEQGHHPDIFLAWGKAEITLWTHAIDGLTESDFIMAAKIDQESKLENPNSKLALSS
jgi:4a-hydroxytetrahydrobiopterin dehydratase